MLNELASPATHDRAARVPELRDAHDVKRQIAINEPDDPNDWTSDHRNERVGHWLRRSLVRSPEQQWLRSRV